jgi:hypothetical protein
MWSDTVVVSAAGMIAGFTLRELPRIFLDRVFVRAKKTTPVESNGNGTAGEKSVLYWRDANRTDVALVVNEVLRAEVLPLLNRQTGILESLARTNEAMKDGVIKLVTLAERDGR